MSCDRSYGIRRKTSGDAIELCLGLSTERLQQVALKVWGGGSVARVTAA